MAIQVNSDEVTLEEECFTVKMRPHRRELIQRFILSEFPNAKVSFSSADVKRDACHLKVEKEKDQVIQDMNAGINNNRFGVEQTQKKAQSKESMTIQTLGPFELSVNQDQIFGKCEFITKDRYSITITVRKNPKPTYPVLTMDGRAVYTQQPPDQQTMELATNLILTSGSRIELGGIISDLRNKQNKVSIEPNANIQTTNQSGSERVFMSLN